MSLNPFNTTWEDPTDTDPQDFHPANPRPMQRYANTLPHDIALAGGSEEDILEILKSHNLTPTEFDYINDLPEFRREVAEWRQKMQSEGYGFKLKLRAIAEAYVPEIINLLNDKTGTVAPSVKTDLFKSVVKWSGLEPQKNEQQQQGDSNRITIQINTFGGTENKAIDITPRIGTPE